MTADRPIYLDHHATTPVDDLVVEAMLPFFAENFGNASSTNHRYGEVARAAVDEARNDVGALIGTDPRGIVFTSGATEANNLAILGVVRAAGPTGHIIVNAAEHRAVLDPARHLAKSGYEVTVLPVDDEARVDPDRVRTALRPETRLVSVMLANNEVGTINPIEEIARICQDAGVPLHCDAAQAVGRIPVDFARLGADLLSVTAHKLYGPKGVGALVVRRGPPRVRIEPIQFGGGHERRLRSGTVPVPLVVGFGCACRLAGERLEADAAAASKLRDALATRLDAGIPGLRENGSPSARLPGNLSVTIPDLDGDALLASLTEVAISTGSACSTTEPEPSHVLRAMGHSDAEARATIRFGVGRGTTMSEVERAADHVVAAVARLRRHSSSAS